MSTDVMSTETIGEKLRHIREVKELPLRKVAALLDIDVAILSKMERGERMSDPKLQAFADSMRKIMDARAQEVRDLGTGKLEHFINPVPRNCFGFCQNNPEYKSHK